MVLTPLRDSLSLSDTLYPCGFSLRDQESAYLEFSPSCLVPVCFIEISSFSVFVFLEKICRELLEKIGLERDI